MSRGLVQVLVVLLVLGALSSAVAVAATGTRERDGAPTESEGAQPFGAECRTGIQGSHVTAYCHNPYPETDHLRLHIECERWWDIDTDSAPVPAKPARTVRLTGRCWKEVKAAWVSHHR